MTVMSAERELLALLNDAALDVRVDAGWGVDALVGRHTEQTDFNGNRYPR
ncbi:MAG TPA: hypothetical protein VFI00_06675 [Kribbella sp.]|nr:hypothetical protein [Kribbella sp.]